MRSAGQCLMTGTDAALDLESDCVGMHIVHCRVIVDNKKLNKKEKKKRKK